MSENASSDGESGSSSLSGKNYIAVMLLLSMSIGLLVQILTLIIHHMFTLPDGSTNESVDEQPIEDGKDKVEDCFHGINVDETLLEPLYEGANLSVLDSYFQLMQFSLRHSLTKQAFSDLLNLVCLHLPTNPSMSVYKLKKFFLSLFHDISFSKHRCCSSCDTLLDNNRTGTCPTPRCRGAAIEFLSVSIAAQLKRKLEGMIQCYME